MIKEKIDYYKDFEVYSDTDSDEDIEHPIIISQAIEDVYDKVIDHWIALIAELRGNFQTEYAEYRQRFDNARINGERPDISPLFRAEGEAFIDRHNELNQYVMRTGFRQ